MRDKGDGDVDFCVVLESVVEDKFVGDDDVVVVISKIKAMTSIFIVRSPLRKNKFIDL